MTLVLSLTALLVSVVTLFLLGTRDAKRRRAHGLPPVNGSPRWLVILAVAPGVVLAFLGQWPAWLIWAGGASVAGWAVAAVLAGQGRTTS